MSKRTIVWLMAVSVLVAGMSLAGCAPKAGQPGDQPSNGQTAPSEPITVPTEAPASDLKSEDLVVGTGAEAKAGSTVSVHYTLWLTDGTKLESSKDSGQPFTFALGQGQVIPGWDQGVVGMKVGGKRKLTIPPDLAYGESGSGPVPPGATLVFEIEMLDAQQ